MALREEFSDALRRAEEWRSKGRAPREIFLHQVIAGGQRSGKTYLARQYINALVAGGFVEDKVVEVTFPGRFTHDMLKDAQHAKGGVLLVDDIYGSDPMGALNDIRHAMVTNECTVVLLGSEELTKNILRDDALAQRMNRPVILKQEPDEALQHPMSVRRNPFTLRPRGRKAENA